MNNSPSHSGFLPGNFENRNGGICSWSCVMPQKDDLDDFFGLFTQENLRDRVVGITTQTQQKEVFCSTGLNHSNPVGQNSQFLPHQTVPPEPTIRGTNSEGANKQTLTTIADVKGSTSSRQTVTNSDAKMKDAVEYPTNTERRQSGSKRRLYRNPQFHSLTERKRRERFNDRIRALHKLLPFSNKLDKVSVLDNAIQYIKFMQQQLKAMPDWFTAYNFRCSLGAAGEQLPCHQVSCNVFPPPLQVSAFPPPAVPFVANALQMPMFIPQSSCSHHSHACCNVNPVFSQPDTLDESEVITCSGPTYSSLQLSETTTVTGASTS